jgi:hypothetical protein
MQIVPIVSLVLLAIIGLYFGTTVARGSEKAQKIEGGQPARMLHFLACVVLASIAPSVMCQVLVLHTGSAFWTALVMIGILFVLLLAYAAFELPAKAKIKKKEDKGWTAEDARTSGL